MTETGGRPPGLTPGRSVPGSGPVTVSQMRWQCRRGMRELDELLVNYLEHAYPQAGGEQKQAFRALLALPDPKLIGYLLGVETPEDRAIAGIVRDIRNHPQT